MAAAVVAALDALPDGLRVASFVDLPILSTLPETSRLNDRGFIVVPIVQRWVVPNAALPCTALVRLFVHYQPRRAGPGASRGVVFLLDGDRRGPPAEAGHTPAPHRFDNRYLYPICRFPPARFLLHDRIEAVYWLSQEGIAPDLLEYAQTLAGAGLTPREGDLRGITSAMNCAPTHRLPGGLSECAF